MSATPCRCSLYKFPHRYTRDCFEREREERDNRDRERTQSEIDAEMLYLHDAAEARAINSGAW